MTYNLPPVALWFFYLALSVFVVGFFTAFISILQVAGSVPPRRWRTKGEQAYYASQHHAEFFTAPHHKVRRSLVFLGFGACATSLALIFIIAFAFGQPVVGTPI